MSEAVKVSLPMLGLTMSEGAISRWLRDEGEAVRKGDPLCEIETDKAIMEVEAPADGVLLRRVVAENVTVPVGTTVAWVGEAGAQIPDGDAPEMPAPAAQPEPAAVPAEAPQPAAPPARKLATPRARKLAEDKSIDWRALDGTGPGGQITEADVKAALAVAAAAQAAAPRPLSTHRQIIADRLSRSAQERPHIYLSLTVDMSAAAAFRGDHAAVSYNDLFVKALAVCLAEFPLVNASLIDEKLVRHSAAHIGFAVAPDDETLFVPVIRDAGAKSLEQIGEARRALVEKAKAKRLTPDEMSGGTFTLSNLGLYGVEQFTAIINPPESGIMALGAVRDEVRAIDGIPAVRQVLTATLSVDHRVVDGAAGARFLARFKNLIEHPEVLA